MGNKSSIWELCMVFGVVAIVLAGFMSTASASDDQKSAISWSRSEGSHTKIDSSLVQKMEERPDSKVPVIIVMKEQQKAPFNVREAKSLTISSQKSLTASLEKIQARNMRALWIVNAVSATVSVHDIDKIAARPDVKKVCLDEQIKRIETNGAALFGTGAYSRITMPSIDIADYGDDVINAPLMWARGYEGINVNISILDTGIDDTHPDLIGKVVAEEDFTGDGTTDDLHGHGTHCAGIAAGKYNTSTDVTGVAPGATLINAKVLNETGYGNTSEILSGIQMSMDHNADIMSMSFGEWQGDGTGRSLESMAVTNAVKAGYVVVIAAGNSGSGEGTIGSPAVAYDAIVVAASDSNDAVVDFSSRGPTGDGRIGIDVAAPGYKIIAPNAFWEGNVDYVLKSGTSMSCPHVAGAAALLLQANPDLTPEEVESTLKNGADVIDVDQADQSRVVYYAFDVDDIDSNDTQRELIENSENWLRVAGMSTGSVLVIDDENYLGSDDDQSVDKFQSVFENLGYTVTVEESDKTSYSTWSNYDIVVWSCGDDKTPIYDSKYKRMLIDYVTDGGHLLLESGSIAYWIDRYGSQVIDLELREEVLHATNDWVYSDVGNLTISNPQHPIATTPNVLPATINFTPTNRVDDSGDADAVRILPDAVGICNWSYVKREGGLISDSIARISYSLIAYNDTCDTGCGYDVREQGAGRLDVNDAYDVLTNGIMVDPQWFVGLVRSGSYTKTFTVENNGVTEKIVSIAGSTGDAGDWITLPTTVTVSAGGTANFDAVMNVPGGAIGAYNGSIRVNDGTEETIIPVSVNVIWANTKTGPITGSVDEYSGGYFSCGDWIYYTLDVPHTTDLNISLSWTDANNDLDLWLFNSSGDLIGTSATLGMPELIPINSPEAGNWTVAINAWTLKTAQETYTLEITTPTLCGDVNYDGVVTPADAVIVLEMAVRGEYDADADVNGDHMVTSLDAMMVLQVAAGAITV